jgi:hypothetical protein
VSAILPSAHAKAPGKRLTPAIDDGAIGVITRQHLLLWQRGRAAGRCAGRQPRARRCHRRQPISRLSRIRGGTPAPCLGHALSRRPRQSPDVCWNFRDSTACPLCPIARTPRRCPVDSPAAHAIPPLVLQFAPNHLCDITPIISKFGGQNATGLTAAEPLALESQYVINRENGQETGWAAKHDPFRRLLQVSNC